MATGCEIKGKVINSVIGTDCIIEEGAEVNDCVLMGKTVVKSGAVLNYAIIDEDVTVGENAVIGDKKETACKIESKTGGIVVLARGVAVKKNGKIFAGRYC